MKAQLAALGPVWDFNYINPITIERRNYVDPSHFRPQVAGLIASTLAANRPPDKLDFGRRLTAATLEATLAWQRRQLQRWQQRQPELVQLLQDTRQQRNRERFERRAIDILGH
jgi:hypothetical protein